MKRTIHRPGDHESCVQKAIELLQQSEGFLLITVTADSTRICASVSNSLQDEMIGMGIMEFIHQRDLEGERQSAAANNEIH